MPLKRAAIVLAAALFARMAAAAPHRFALLIGIDDYSASRLTSIRTPAPDRDWPNLAGAVNDAAAMRDLLVLLRGFDVRDIALLEEQNATRSAILDALRRLTAAASKDDVIFFYFAGHGSQVRNSRSDEPDKLDESIVPADSRRGALDIRDKELRRIFNAILDRGARLTVMIDACHSGSGARGLLTLARPRGIAPDLRDVADGGDYGPRPENRGALVISASHDDEEALEVRDDRQIMHGAFTWAWMRAMRDAAADEPAIDTFTRAQARLRAEMPFQNPVLAGNAAQRFTPFLGTSAAARGERVAFAVERVHDGTAIISGGWAHGITVGSELRVIGDRAQPPLEVTALLDLGRCEARLPAGAHVRSGALLELTRWAAPSPRPLRVAIPRADIDVAAFARRAAAMGIRSIADPTVRTPGAVLRRAGLRWEILGASGRASAFETDEAALTAAARLHGSLFIQLPATPFLADSIGGSGAVMVVGRAEEADYVLTGRFVRGRIEYAWVRPNATRDGRRASGLPVRTAWIRDDADAALSLRDRAQRLQRIAMWTLVDSPPGPRWPYHLVLRRDADQQIVGDGGRVSGGETYTLEMQAGSAVAAGRRHVYVFAIDSSGESTLLFPVSGSVENHFPLAGPSAPAAIPLGAKLEIAPPYGIDTYVLLATDEPLANPWIFSWEGVRSARSLAAPGWSIERMAIESVRPRHER
jgi:hypothetical protein